MPAPPIPQLGLVRLDGTEVQEEDPATMDSPPDAPPRGFNAGRRKQVMSAPVEVALEWCPPVFRKTLGEKQHLRLILANNVLLKGLAEEDIEVILDAFQGLEFEAKTQIITQGDDGDRFYVLESGACDIMVAGDGLVNRVQPGGTFGELALLYDAPRAATVIATEPSRVWALDRGTFKQILVGTSVRRNARYEAFLDMVPVLASLGRYEKLKLTDAVRTKSVMNGERIISEGCYGDAFYIITEGEVKCTKRQTSGEEVEVCRRLKVADFFGEQALLYTERRAASVTATRDSQLLVIDRETFLRLLGPLEDIIQREADQQQRLQ
mmetsp:Transcript_69140/g.114940  ORF Transcript_69140/g.114940 Transcript_69140/m.114940 type:complete len:323 (+) Transcript_69140:114-1082(+)|eukprot:CAMPEP_0119319670 /NCGR_PEP_ID=MMETSP1333-20130426/50030_1 /TAXON_ID=418940 /ORGANISM="Scyphosphaera apsteinii, Strain RCC1455" /LENGTH=322 /DNA_ID=CAMNT_0007326139 /DNA_START=114 /DNA_END=1082 /DNA_ORIENTATION=+